jgi:hypothetical protein
LEKWNERTSWNGMEVVVFLDVEWIRIYVLQNGMKSIIETASVGIPEDEKTAPQMINLQISNSKDLTLFPKIRIGKQSSSM